MKTSFIRLLFFVVLFSLSAHAQTTGDYRSAATGNWATLTTWETYNGSAWIAATVVPGSTSGVITIQSPHTVTIAAAATIDQVIVNSGAILSWTAGALTIANGTGIDLSVFGEFRDFRGATPSIAFAASATWTLNTTGTIVRNSSNSNNNWQNAYNGGISAIVSTTNWIIRKTGAQNPVPTSIGGFYGNLAIENTTAGAFTTPLFSGSTGFPTIKGNLDIGGTGTAAVTFTNTNTFSSPILIIGNLLIRPLGTLVNSGTGVRVEGDVTISGTLSYGGANARYLLFAGGNAQAINGSGAAAIYDLTVSKSAGSVTLNRPITVDDLATFTSGNINSSATNLLTIAATGSVTGASNASFVNGPVRFNGYTAFTFPTGKITSSGWYRPIGISATTGAAPTILYTEPFNSMGSWTTTVLGAEGADPNFFTDSDNEGGVPVGSCGVATNGNPTLHVTSVFNPSGGAAYDAGGLCGFLYCPQTNRRQESGVISCVGYTGLQAQFKYIENGSGTTDNAQFWYYDGSTWTMIDDMPKTATGCSGQGIWALRTVNLPASADNNPNVRFGFSWINNDDGAGTDPSLAVDDLQLIKPGIPSDPFQAEFFPANPQTTFNNILEPGLSPITECEYWILDRIGTTTQKVVTLSWNNAMWSLANCLVTVPADVLVARWDGAMWRNHGNASLTGSAAAGTVSSSAPVTSFSPFTLSFPITAPLPVELVFFRGDCATDAIGFSWQTASETNNDYFEIERSADLQAWITEVRIDGAGTKIQATDYAYTAPISKEHYYRLAQVDLDGNRKTYSPVFTDCGTAASGIVIAPNPTDGVFSVRTGGPAITRIDVTNMRGQLIQRIDVNADHPQTEWLMDLSTAANGVYQVTFYSETGVEVKRVVKN